MKKLSLCILLSSLTILAFGWGQTGHRVIGQIAQNHLDKKAKKAIFEILGHHSLAEVSNWMDDIKSDSSFDNTHAWHYVTVPDGKIYAETDKSANGDAYEAVQRMIAILKNEKSNKVEQIEALKMLVHLVGDLHQPLHVGNGEDRGGNSVKIKWFYKPSNLHRIWDSEMIESKDLSYSELSAIIDHPYEENKAVFTSTNIDVWVKEAQDLRPQIYAIDDAENLSYEYRFQNWPIVMLQLHKGGLRLAAILNKIYG